MRYKWITCHGLDVLKKFFFIFFSVVFFFTAVHPLAGLTVTPLVIDFELDPGGVDERMMVITNESSSSVKTFPRLFQVVGTDMNGFPQLKEIDQDAPLARMISFPGGTSYIIGPGEKKKISVRVQAPLDEKPGGRYGVISWGTHEVREQISFSGQPGINIVIAIRGAVSESARISRFETREAGTIFFRPTGFEVDVENTGGRHITPTGTVTIRDIFHRSVAVLPLSPRREGPSDQKVRILPGTKRTLFAQWGEGWALGPYTATVRITAEDTINLSSRLTFTVVPIAFIGISLSLMLILCLMNLFRK